jgi:hypothetical protein
MCDRLYAQYCKNKDVILAKQQPLKIAIATYDRPTVGTEVRVTRGTSRQTSVTVALGTVRKHTRRHVWELCLPGKVGQRRLGKKVLIVVRVEKHVDSTSKKQELLLQRPGDRESVPPMIQLCKLNDNILPRSM